MNHKHCKTDYVENQYNFIKRFLQNSEHTRFKRFLKKIGFLNNSKKRVLQKALNINLYQNNINLSQIIGNKVNPDKKCKDCMIKKIFSNFSSIIKFFVKN